MHQKWAVIGRLDSTALLGSEIDAEVLTITTDLMEQSCLVEWPSARTQATKSIGLWCLHRLHDSYHKDLGQTSIQTYFCPLKNRTKRPVKIHVTRSLPAVVLKT